MLKVLCDKIRTIIKAKSNAISLKHNWGCAFGPEHVVSLNTIKKRLGLIIKDYYSKVSTQGKTN